MRIVSNLISKFLSVFAKPSIVFESKPDFSDNTKAVFDEFVQRGLDKKYDFIWFISWSQCALLKNGTIQYWDPIDKSTIKKRFRNYSYYHKTKCIISCNTYLTSRGSKDYQVTFGKNQISFHLTHGTPIKSLREYYPCPEGIDYLLSASPKLDQLMAYEFKMDISRVFSAGFPRNDVFSRKSISLNGILGTTFSKIIIWYPTYRQHYKGTVVLPGDSIPLIHDNENAISLNKTASENNVLIIIKPHFVQDQSFFNNVEMSNIWMIDDSFFDQHGFTSYELLAASDALLTDYSSVLFDYTLHDKPIGVVWEDIDSYREYPGFALDLDYYMKGVEKIYNIDELCGFIRQVANDEDRLQEERREIRDIVNISTDGRNAARVVDFIIEKASL